MKPKQSIPKNLRFTVENFHRKFPDDEACLEFLKEKRYPEGIAHCIKCKRERKHHRVTGRPAYACDYCGSMISPMAGTIFEKSSTSLKKWFYAMYLMGSTRCGISAKQIQRECGVTYKTAWRMFKQIRSLLSEPDMQLEGSTVEIDETYVGGKRKFNSGRKLRADAKKLMPVLGMAERGGRVRAFATPDVKITTVMPLVREFVLPKSTVYTDERNIYERVQHVPGMGYVHKRIQHNAKVYVAGDVHTNTIEGFWSLVKRGLGGVYHSVSQKYLQSYLDEYSFRYNRRASGNLIFPAMLAKVSEKVSLKPSLPAEKIRSV